MPNSSCSPDGKSVPLDNFNELVPDLVKKSQSPDCTLKKLHELICDDITNSNESWIARLLHNFLREHGANGFKIKDLPILMQILEFLARRASDISVYRVHLETMLEKCKLPPLLQKTSDSLGCLIILERYIDSLGYVITTLLDDTDILKVVQAVDCLLRRPDERRDIAAVKADICIGAVEKSRFPIIMSKLVENVSWIIYPQVLELVFLMVANSCTCCYKMLQAGILDYLLMRMDVGMSCTDSNKSSNLNAEIVSGKECLVISTNIVWVLLRSVLSPSKLLAHRSLPPVPSEEATRALRSVFKKQVCNCCQGGTDAVLRNDLAVLILMCLAVFPSWQLVSSGLAEDLLELSIAIESGTTSVSVLAEVSMPRNIEKLNIAKKKKEDDIFFKKILLSILHELCKRSGAGLVAIMVECQVMRRILELVKPSIKSSYLSESVLRILACLVQKMPEEFIRHEGNYRLSSMLPKWSNMTVEFDSHELTELTRTLVNIVTSNQCPSLLEAFRKAELDCRLIDLVDRILKFNRLTLEHQRILTYLITTIEEMTKVTTRCSLEKLWGHRNIKILIKSLERCFYQRNNDFQTDQRLLIAIGSHIWSSVVSCYESAEQFEENGGVYMLLDVAEESIFPVRCVYLGILADMCSAGYGITQLCTWREANKEQGLMALLAKTWREEEIRKGVKRTPEGLIEDTELPIMGTEQWMKAFRQKATCDSSPTLDSLVGSVRPKIHCLRKIMTHQTHGYEQSRERYKIFLNDSSELMTLYVADQYYRFCQGQVWSEVSRFLEQQGVHVLGMDGEIIALMSDRHSGWANYVRGLQEGLLRAKRKKETEILNEELTRIRNSKLASSLDALKEIDYMRRTMDRDYMVRRKRRQISQIRDSFRCPVGAEGEHYHACFDEKSNVTTIFQDTYTVPNSHVLPPETSISEVLPVSPTENSSLRTSTLTSGRSSLDFDDMCRDVTMKK